jgi:uncharacterized protein
LKFEREAAEGRNTFTGYGPGYVEVNGRRHGASLVVSGDQLITDWPATSVDTLTADHLATLITLAPEIILLGTGPRFQFPEPARLAALYQAGIGVEAMDTPAACRTYNILLGEGRHVVAALLL